MNAALNSKYAGQCIKQARKLGGASIGGLNTATGRATLRCVDGVYELTTLCLSTFNNIVLATGKPAQIRPVLASLYTI